MTLLDRQTVCLDFKVNHVRPWRLWKLFAEAPGWTYRLSAVWLQDKRPPCDKQMKRRLLAKGTLNLWSSTKPCLKRQLGKLGKILVLHVKRLKINRITLKFNQPEVENVQFETRDLTTRFQFL